LKGATIALAGDLLGERKVDVGFLGWEGSLTSSGPVDIESPDSKFGDTLVGRSSGVISSLSLGLKTEIEFPRSSEGDIGSSGDTGVFPLT